MKFKEIIVGVFSFVVAVTTLPQIYSERKVALAEEATVVVEGKTSVRADSDYEYKELYDGTLCITKYKGIGGDVAIPEQIDGKTVTQIYHYAFMD